MLDVHLRRRGGNVENIGGAFGRVSFSHKKHDVVFALGQLVFARCIDAIFL